METLFGPSVDDQSSSVLDNGPDHSPNKSSSVLTLEPYSYVSSGTYNSRKSRLRNNRIEITPGSFESSNYARFLILKMKSGQKMRDFDMFELNREILGACEKEPKISFLNDGTLLIEVSSAEESRKIQSIVSLAGNNVESMPHKRLNQVKGVIRSVELLRYPEDKIQRELKDQGVVEVKQMKKTVGGLLTPLPTYVLTFDRLNLPNYIRAAWLRIEVRPYIPSCRRCFFCQKYGHVVNNCRRKMKGEKSICENCGQEEHGECDNQSSCINCGESHPASSKKCERFLFEKEVQAVRAREHLGFKEARQQVSARYIRPQTLFSSIASKKNLSNGKKVSMTNESRPVQGNQERTAKNRPNPKRRLSGEKEESASSKIHLSNPFDVLNDEMNIGKSNSTEGQIMELADPSVSAGDINLAETSSLACVQDRVGDSSSASGLDRAEKPISICPVEQIQKSSLASINVTNSSELIRSSEETEITTHDIPLERADSFLSVYSEHEDALPSLDNKIKTQVEKRENSSNGAISKLSHSTHRDMKQENDSRAEKIPKKQENTSRIPRKIENPVDNRATKKAVILRKTNKSSS